MTNNIVRKSINFDPKHEFNFRKSANVMNMPILLNCIDTGLFFHVAVCKRAVCKYEIIARSYFIYFYLSWCTKNFLYLLIIAKG